MNLSVTVAAVIYGQFQQAKHEQYLKCGVVAAVAAAGVAVHKAAEQEAAATQLKQLTLLQARIFKFAQQAADVVGHTKRLLMDARAGYVHKAAAAAALGLLA